MAGPSIMVRVLGDVSGLAKSFTQTQSAGATAAGKMGQAFKGALGALNQTGVLGPFGATLDGISNALDQVAEHGKDVSGAMLGVGAAMVGVGVGLSLLGSKDQAAHQQLQQAVEATGRSYSDYSDQVDAAIKHQEKFGDSAVDTQNALRVLTTATNDPAKALQLLGTATDLAAAKHEDLATAATQLGKVYNGNTKLLKEFGIQTTATTTLSKGATTAQNQATAADKAYATAKQKLADLEAIDAGSKKLTVAQAIALRNAEQNVTAAAAKAQVAHEHLTTAQQNLKTATAGNGTAITELSTKLHGQASAAADTFAGRLNGVKATVEDFAASMGQKYGPAVTAAGSALTGLGAAMKVGQAATQLLSDSNAILAVQVYAIGAAEKVTAAAQWLLNAAMDANPIGLIVLGIVALIGIMILLATHCAAVRDAFIDMGKFFVQVWNTIWSLAQTVFGWIKAYWPLIAGILLGPVALAAALIYMHWRQILSGLQVVWDWIRSTWNAVYGFIVGPVNSAVAAITGAWNGFIGFFAGVPGDIARIAGGMWDGIFQSFRSMINDIIDIWNQLHFSLPSASVFGHKIGGETIGVPTIPHLSQGGLITQTGVIFAHAGEAIIPAPAGGTRTGPAVNIEHATFANELDVETFMRRAAWVVQTQRV